MGREGSRERGQNVRCKVAEAPPLQTVPDYDLVGAFYSEKLPSGTGRVVVLNTNLYYSSNEQTAGMADPGQQFQWLGDVLSNASRDGEMVSTPASSCAPGSLPDRNLPPGTDLESYWGHSHPHLQQPSSRIGFF